MRSHTVVHCWYKLNMLKMYVKEEMFLNGNITFLSADSNSILSALMTTATGSVYAESTVGGLVSFRQTADTSFCGRVTDGSIATSQGTYGHLVTGDIFRRLATAPVIFNFNFQILERSLDSPGVCSLTVKWSC